MDDIWQPAETAPLLSSGIVQVYRARRTHSAARVAVLESQLPADEQQAAARFRMAGARERFVLGRAMLRSVLARQLDATPDSIALHFTGHGKPRLENESNVHFNLSHSGDIVMLALASDMQLGVDVEQHRRIKRRDQIAEGIMSQSELAQYAALAEPDRQRAFFHLWTQKEAIVKALGRGLLFPLTDVEVSLNLAEVKLIRFGEDATELPYHLTSIACPAEYTAALATSEVCDRISSFRWPS